MGDLTSGEWFAIVIALMSFSVALVSLAWNILNATRIDRARLKVKLWAAMVKEQGGGLSHVVVVQATNVGKRPVELSGLWIKFGPRPRWWHGLLPRPLRSRVYKSDKGGILVPGEPWFSRMPDPVRLDVGGSVSKMYGYDDLREQVSKIGTPLVYGSAEGSTASAYTRRAVAANL